MKMKKCVIIIVFYHILCASDVADENIVALSKNDIYVR